jgi:phenylalanyl-tRNA synthetase alpha subunit
MTADEMIAALRTLESDFNDDLAALERKYLGQEGGMTRLLKEFGTLSAEDRRRIGPAFNEFKFHVEVLARRSRDIAPLASTG